MQRCSHDAVSQVDHRLTSSDGPSDDAAFSFERRSARCEQIFLCMLQDLLETLAAAGGPQVVVPIPGASEDLQEPQFVDEDAVAYIAEITANAQRKGARVSAGTAELGRSSGRPAGRGQGEEVRKLKPVKTVKGASEALQEPKILQVAAAEL